MIRRSIRYSLRSILFAFEHVTYIRPFLRTVPIQFATFSLAIATIIRGSLGERIHNMDRHVRGRENMRAHDSAVFHGARHGILAYTLAAGQD